MLLKVGSKLLEVVWGRRELGGIGSGEGRGEVVEVLGNGFNDLGIGRFAGMEGIVAALRNFIAEAFKAVFAGGAEGRV